MTRTRSGGTPTLQTASAGPEREHDKERMSAAIAARPRVAKLRMAMIIAERGGLSRERPPADKKKGGPFGPPYCYRQRWITG